MKIKRPTQDDIDERRAYLKELLATFLGTSVTAVLSETKGMPEIREAVRKFIADDYTDGDKEQVTVMTDNLRSAAEAINQEFKLAMHSSKK